MIGARLLRLAGRSTTRLFVLIMLVTAGIGAFISNTGTVALMLPIVVSMSAGAGVSASRFLMPLAFASSLGGMTTLIGTPPNLVIEEILRKNDLAHLTFFFIPARRPDLCEYGHHRAPAAEQMVPGPQSAGQRGTPRRQEPERTGQRIPPERGAAAPARYAAIISCGMSISTLMPHAVTGWTYWKYAATSLREEAVF